MSSEESFRVIELSLQGFSCSQILALMALEAQGKSAPEVVRAMSGLVAGCGAGKLCGALTGGCCVLGMYAGKGSSEEQENVRLPLMLSQLVEWFESQYGAQYGGIDCSQIIQDDAMLKMTRCPQVVAETLEKVKEILAENEYELSQSPTPGQG
jgi:C_GCAxxG_C_C family probable redox protein